MSKIHETGHAKNVENFSKLDAAVISFGDKYAPSEARLQRPNLCTVRHASQASLEAVNLANPPFLQAIGRRETAFIDVPRLASRALGIAETLHLDPVTIKALKELVRKLYGRRATPKKPVAENPDAEGSVTPHHYISVSQLSFDQRINHFAQFVDILKAEPAYEPAEQELSIEGLEDCLAEMRASNDAVTEAAISLTNARSTRNTLLYAPLTGLVDVAFDVKKYVRAAFGNDSAEYGEIKGLAFTRA